VRIAYLVNQYPLTSHSFIRREIHALEALGAEVVRYSIRPTRDPLPTEADRAERRRTRAVLDSAPAGLLAALLLTAAARPAAFLRALRWAIRLGRAAGRGVARHVVYLAEACVLARWARADRIEHLHAHFGTNSAAVALLSREVGGPRFSFTVHGPEEFDAPAALSLRDKVSRAEFVAAISSYGRAQLWRWVRSEDWAKVQVVRCGVDEALLGAPASPVPAARRLLCVARLGEQKGHLLLLEAAARLAAEGADFEIVLVGDGPLRPRIEAGIARLGLAGRVRVAGWKSAAEVREELLASRALLLPSFAEGLPVVIMEALALARPVITTAVAGIPELVEGGVTGWVVPAGSVDALVPAMREALDADPERLGDMGRAGAARVSARHDVRKEAAALAALFQAAGAAAPARTARELAPAALREDAA
jgi:glycosyltransferase involved in cell wall biosynthesis